MAFDLGIPLEEVQDQLDQLLNILQPHGLTHVALPIHNAVLQPAEAVWHMLVSCTCTPKRVEGRYFVLAKGGGRYFPTSLWPRWSCTWPWNGHTSTPTLIHAPG